MLQINDIHKSYGEKHVLNGISFSVEKGKVTSLIGRNGSGKTTMLEILSRIISQDGGFISIDDKKIDEDITLQQNIAFLPDRFDLFKYSNALRIMEFYEIIYPHFDREFVKTELTKLRISPKRDVRNLSKGQSALLGLVIILATGADYILLDEILDGIDVVNRRKVIEYVLDATAAGRAVLISSHSLDELESISDTAIYISLDGSLQAVDQSLNLNKFQIVLKETLKKEDREKLFITGEIGRVITILTEDSFEEVQKKLKTEIIQHDIIPVKYEDVFYYESIKEDR
ncbi:MULTISPECIES: ABC transporter ATP-binding protein [Peptoniphilus]|uniref:ATP-binding cassette domain-containing protein n=1 Tax=Peptoniphilus TaxID=162289 RepID=UPI0003B8F6F7|nr:MULTISPECIES: ABC transporter ATP-binding protein [Peptoniphilus]ERT63497.1 ABC transporter, ATP-binding protein [Peptoniphilus sp. BV3AC2]MDK8275481.1 ABC transporter ATP-binding protein [Peptoniphilus duerdenii]